MNSDHKEILDKGVDKWNKWRRQNPNIIPDLSSVFLKDLNLEGINLSNAILTNINIENINFNRSNFKNAKISESTIKSSKFIDSFFGKSELQESHWFEVNLTGASIQKSNLNRIFISKSSVNGVEFSESQIKSANFKNCGLAGCEFYDVDLFNSSIDHCDLSGSMIRNSNLTRGTFFEVDFSECDLGDLVFARTKIWEPVNLDKCRFSAPCSIDISTLRSSKDLSLKFYRGVGLYDWEIEIAKLFDNKLNPSEINDIIYKIFDLRTKGPIEFYSCFISYSHSDKKFALKLYNSLQNKGIRCWLDEKQLLPGDDIRDGIDKGIKTWDKVILCCSKKSLNSYWVNNEIDKALKKEEKLWEENKKRINAIIPLYLDNYLFEWDNSRASILTDRYAENLVDWENDDEKFEKSLERIYKALRPNNHGREIPPKPKL